MDNSTQSPEWEFRYIDDMDLIGDGEYLHGYYFSIHVLEDEDDTYSSPVFKALLKALKALKTQKKAWRDSSFTVFCGDCGLGGDMFYIGFSCRPDSDTDGNKIFFMRPYFKDVPAFEGYDSGSSSQFAPIFRYDAGHIIRYGDDGQQGQIKTDEEFESGLTFHYRVAASPYMAGLDDNKSVYGKLKQ